MNNLPKDLVLAVTYNCNSRCRMCNIWKSEAMAVLPLAQYQKLPASFQDINLSGGEPFLRPDLVDLVKILIAKNPRARIIISTNGFATELILKTMKQIYQLKPHIGVGISIDGIGTAHDQIRGVPGGFERAMATLKGLQQIGVKNLRLAFTAGDYNIGELMKVYKLANELGVEFTLAAIHNTDNYFNAVDNQITKHQEFKNEFSKLIVQELRSFSFKHWLRAYFAFALLYFVLTQRRLLPNYSGRDNVFIDPSGDVYPADVSGHVMGNLKDFKTFEELYFSAEAQESIALEKSNQNWMICTARTAMKKHPLAVLGWIIKSKLWGFKI